MIAVMPRVQMPDESYRVSTVDLRADFLRPAPAVDLVCEAVVTHRGKKLVRVCVPQCTSSEVVFRVTSCTRVRCCRLT